ncbi:leucine-rich repeat domain-containing protein [Coraliomargarita sinensis]|nr:leucine-rich repeat domain-containing protein [Coraliomargarita sinensis]
MKNLKVLSLSENLIESKNPNLIYYLKKSKVELISISKNRLVSCSFLSKVSDIKAIDLSENLISRLGDGEDMSNSIEYLDLKHNKISAIAQKYKFSNKLEYLNLSNNQLKEFNSPAECVDLTDLDISDNRLKHFPGQILELDKLATLNLSGNAISQVDSELIRQLVTIKGFSVLDISNNSISTIELILVKENDRYDFHLDISGNPLGHIYVNSQ